VVLESDPHAAAIRSEASVEDKVNEVLRRISREKLRRFDPYGFQKEFFEAGSHYEERMLRAGNRCISPWTAIETGFGSRRLLEFPPSKDFGVLSMVDESECVSKASGVFLKNIEPAYRVLTDKGFFDCSRMHRVYADGEWVSFDALIRLSSGLRCVQSIEDYRASCGAGDYQYGEELRVAGSDLTALPLKDDVQKLCLSFSLEDVEERISQYSRVYQWCVQFPIEDDPDLIVDLCDLFQDPGVYIRALQQTRIYRECLQRVAELDPDELERLVDRDRKNGEWSYLQKSSGAANKPARYIWKGRNDDQSVRQFDRSDASIRYLGDAEDTEIFFPYSTPDIGCKIIAVLPLGYQPIIDFTVEDTKSYFAGGALHHNTGKTISACAEDAYHLTGEYPDWWEGKRFLRSTRGWVVSITNEISRDILQLELLGEPIGTGMIPYEKIIDVDYRQCGISNVVDKVFVQHKKGISWVQFKCYEQGWKKFVGAAIDFVHFDEEPDDIRVYTESRIRIVTRNGVMYSTITPLMGETELMQRFMAHHEGCFLITASMADCPHLEGKVDGLLENFPAHEKEARMNGTPVMGEGRVFPYADGDVITGHIPIPKHWSRICGIDFGINDQHQQAACWLAHDREADIVYLYDVYKAPNRKISDHCEAIKARGKWIPVAWPHDGTHREKGSGQQLREGYLDRDVAMLTQSARYKRDKGGGQPTEPVVNDVCERIETGRFKVFPHCRQWMDEFRSFHRKDGVIQVKKDDALKASFYALMELRNARTEPQYREQRKLQPVVRAWAN